MVNINYIIREDNTGKIISEDAMLDAVDIEETLRLKYNYLYNSMKETEYKLKVNHCTYFKEIIFKKKVVGFFAYTIINSVSNLSMIASYILPEYRGKSLFFDEINNIFEEGNEISIYNPPHYIMEILVKNGFAKKIDDNLIVSSIKIDIPSNTIIGIYGSEKIIYEDYVYSSSIYDTDKEAFIVMPTENNNVIYLSKNDKESKVNVNDEYFEYVVKTITEKKDVIHNFLSSIQNSYQFTESPIEEEDIDFEKLKNIKKNEQINENLLDNFEEKQNDKNALTNYQNIDKEKYVEAYQNVGIYDFIQKFEENDNLELTNSIINIDYEFKKDYLKNITIKKGFITNEADIHEENKYLNSLKVNDLKDILKNNNLPVSGNKSDLIERIINYVPSNAVVNTDYYVSEKGLIFLEEHNDIYFYTNYLKDFIYYEFKEFLSKNSGKISDVAKLFLKEHLKNSVNKGDNKCYTDSLTALALINEVENNYEDTLFYELKKFIVGLNPIFLDEKLYNYYQPINKNNIDHINLLLSENKLELKNQFEKAWEKMEIKEFLISKDKSYNILEEMISGNDRDYMNDKIREKYLRKENVSHDRLDKSVQSTLDTYFTY